MRKLFCLFLCGMLLLASYPASAGFFSSKDAQTETKSVNADFRYEGPGFDTPEDAVLYYLAGLKNLDIEQMLGAFSWETQAAHYSFRDLLLRNKGIEPTYVPGMPFDGGFSTAANVENMRNQTINLIYTAFELWMLGESHWSESKTGAIRIQEEAEADAYLKLFDPEKLRKLTEMDQVRFYDPDDVTEGRFSRNINPESPKAKISYQRQIGVYGADEIQYRVAVADVGDELLCVMPTIARYGDRWYLVSCGSIVSNIMGIAINQQAFASAGETDLFPDAVPVQTTSLPEVKHEAVRYEGAGFDSPEDVVTAYMEGIRNLDIQQMLGVFAWETQISAYSLKNQLLRVNSVNSSMPVRMPGMDGALDSFNLENLRSQESNKIYHSIRTFIVEGPFLDGKRLNLDSEEETDDFIRSLETAQHTRIQKLRQMSDALVVDPGLIVPSMAVPSTQVTMEELRGVFGADELRELMGIATLGSDETLTCDLLIARYGDRWYAVSTGGPAFSYLGVSRESHAFVSTHGSIINR